MVTFRFWENETHVPSYVRHARIFLFIIAQFFDIFYPVFNIYFEFFNPIATVSPILSLGQNELSGGR
jgi:hypothetical protein